MGRNMAQPTIQTPQIAKKLIQALDIHGKVAAPSLGDLIHPVIVVEDVSRDSWYTLSSDLPCGGAAEIGPAAGESAIVQLFNASNNTIAIVDRLVFAPGGTLAAWIATETTQRAAFLVGQSRYRDTRLAGVPACGVCVDHPVGVPGITSPIAAVNGGTVSAQTVDLGYVLNPGQGISVIGITLGILSRVGFFWRERAAS